MENIFSILGFQNIVWLSGIVALAITTLIQGLSSKYKPWTYIAIQIGKAINKETLEKLDNLEKKVNEIEKHDKEQDEKDKEEKAKAARRRILRCADEIRTRVKHSEEYFNDILEDVTFYKKYCDDHPLFKNERSVMAIDAVEKAYKHAHDTDDFL
jgi:glutamine synthetase type III